jgi:hypothetical protein
MYQVAMTIYVTWMKSNPETMRIFRGAFGKLETCTSDPPSVRQEQVSPLPGNLDTMCKVFPAEV